MLYILTDGSYLWTNGTCRSMKKHEIVIIHSQVPHTFSYDCASKYICIKFLPHILYADDQAFFELKYVLPFLEDSTSYTVLDAAVLTGLDVDGLMFETLHEWENRSFGSELIMRANILKLFAAFFRHLHRNELLNADQSISSSMKHALNFISENYATVTEKQAAEISSLSYHYFSAVFNDVKFGVYSLTDGSDLTVDLHLACGYLFFGGSARENTAVGEEFLQSFFLQCCKKSFIC